MDNLEATLPLEDTRQLLAFTASMAGRPLRPPRPGSASSTSSSAAAAPRVRPMSAGPGRAAPKRFLPASRKQRPSSAALPPARTSDAEGAQLRESLSGCEWYAELQGAGTTVPDVVLQALAGMSKDAATHLVRLALAQCPRHHGRGIAKLTPDEHRCDVSAILLAATSSAVSPPQEDAQSRRSSAGPTDAGQEFYTAPVVLLSAPEKRGQKLRARHDPQIHAALSEISEMAAWGDSMEPWIAYTPYDVATKPMPMCSQKLLTSPRVRVLGMNDALCSRHALVQRPASARSATASGAGGEAQGSVSSPLADASNVQERCWEYLRQRHPLLAERHSQSYVQARLQSKGGDCSSNRSSQVGQQIRAADMSCTTCSDARFRASPHSGPHPVVKNVDADAQRAGELISERWSQYISRSTPQQKSSASAAL